MKQLFELTELATSDGLTHEGLFAAPKTKAAVGIVWVHGLTGGFSHTISRTQALAEKAVKNGFAFGIFNNRGHDMVDSEKRRDGSRFFIGGGFERFTDCVKDIDATIRYMRSRGCKKVILVGHSTGANKVAYYASKKRNPTVAGIVLLSGLSDVNPLTKTLRRLLMEATAIAKKKPMAVLSYEKFGVIMNAQRYVSLFTPAGVEDVFPYHRYGGSWRILNGIKTPTFVVIGDKDEHLPIPVKKYLELVTENLKQARGVSAKVIKGATHSFRGYEAQLARTLVNWAKTF